jgi:predicted nucleic acid-binding protein
VKLVVDASVAVKWLIRDPLAEAHLNRAGAILRAIRARAVEAVEPPHWQAEVVSVIARARRHRVTLALGILESLPFRVMARLAIYHRAAELSIALNHHLFDTLYHAVALEEGATLVTADDVYFRKAEHLGAIELLSAFAPTA